MKKSYKNTHYLLLFIVLLVNNLSFSQQPFFDCITPIKIPLTIAGSFAEFRSSHFHTGTDFKTLGMCGLPVFAVDNGYVSRIKVDNSGYGKSVYITHSNGYTSIYGHVEEFSTKINDYCKRQQYEKKSFSVDLYLHATELKVVKGEMIALSGNAGGSSGPHLHFELRNGQNPINVFKISKLSVPDSVSPIIEKLWLYPLNDTSFVNGSRFPVSFSLQKNKNILFVKDSIIKVYGNIGIGIESFDMTNNNTSKTGIFNYKLLVNRNLTFEYRFFDLNIQESRYVNSVNDFEHYKKEGKRITRLFLQPNNRVKNCVVHNNNGIIAVSDSDLKNISIQLFDDQSNRTNLSFSLLGTKFSKIKSEKVSQIKNSKSKRMICNIDNSFVTDSFKLFIPKNALYDDFNFTFSKYRSARYAFSDVVNVHQNVIPLHSYYSISIKPNYLSKVQYNKYLIVGLDEAEEVIWSGGSYENGMVNASVRSFGRYTVMVDTVPPIIETNFENVERNNFTNWSTMSFKIKDICSGISHFSGYIDGKWSLFEYDPKLNLLTHRFDSLNINFHQKHHLKLTVTDEKANVTYFRMEFYK